MTAASSPPQGAVAPPPATALAFAVVVAAWGSSYLFIRLAVESFTPFGLVGLRFGLAALGCAAVARLRGEAFPRGAPAWRLALVGLMMMSGSNALTAWAQASVSSGVAGVMHGLSSVWLAALGTVGAFGPDAPRTPPAAWPGIALGVVGVAVLSWPQPGQLRAETLGVAALLVATLLFALASVLQRRTQAALATAGGRTPGLFAQLAVQMAGGASLALVALPFTGAVHATPTPSAVGALAFLTVVSSVAGFGAYAVVLRHWPPARVGSFAVINPVVALALGMVVLGETPGSQRLVGAAIALAAVAWVQLAHLRRG